MSQAPGAAVVEISHNVVIDVAEDGVPVGIDVDASKIVDLSRLEIEGLRMSQVSRYAEEPYRLERYS